MTFAIDQPWWLATIALALPLGWVAWRWLAAMSLARRWSAIVLRSVLIALLAGMLAGVSLVRQTDRLAVIAVIDISESVQRFLDPGVDPQGGVLEPTERLRDWLRQATRDRGPDDALGVVVFDGRSIGIASPSVGEVLDRTWTFEPIEGTDIARALQYASALAPPDASSRLVLFSDGVQTRGDALRVAEALAGEQGLSVDVVPLDYSLSQEVMVERVDTPPAATAESTITVRVTLRATDPSTGTLRLLLEGNELDINGPAPGLGRRAQLPAGISTELVEVPLPAGRIHRFEALFEPDVDGEGAMAGDTLASNNRGEAFTLTPGRGRVLLVDGVSGGVTNAPGATLARTLEGAGIEVTLIGPEGMPEGVLALQSYDLIILQNVPATALTSRQHDLLVSHVRDLGGGLVMVGGFDSFGAGFWKGTAIEPILPVLLDLPERAVTPEAAVVFVLDNSGSMSFEAFGSVRKKQQIANESAALAVQSLDRQDLVGIIAFNNDTEVVVPLGRNPDRNAVMQKVLNISTGGGTNMGPALREAGRQLRQADAKIKHVIVLSDGRSRAEHTLPRIAEELKADGIRVSTIAIGEDADVETMDRMATLGDGSFHYVLNPNTLPRVFLNAVRVVRQPLIREQAFLPVASGAPSVLTDGLQGMPQLLGLVLTQRRTDPTVQTLLLTPQGEPVLAHWNVELGQVAAFTSDAHGKWSEPWMDWPGYQRLWTNMARAMTRPAVTPGFEIMTALDGDRLNVRVEASDASGRPLDLLNMPTTVHLPGGETVDIRLSQTGPGVYEGQTSATEQGNYIAIVKPEQGTQRLAPVIGGTTAPRGAELRSLRSDTALLERIATAGGGRVLSLGDPRGSRLFDRAGLEPRRAMEPLWRSLLLWTIVVLMLDIGTRRIAWDRLISRQFGVDLRREALDAVRDRSTQVLGALGGITRREPSGEASAIALGDDQAQQLSEEELERRRQTRLAAIRAARQRTSVDETLAETVDSGASTAPPPSAPPASSSAKTAPTSPTPPTANEPSEGGLLAAKRRARERFGGDGDARN